MQFTFEPKRIGYYPSSLSLGSIKIDNNIFLTALNIDFGNNNNNCSIELYDLDGNKIKEKTFLFSTDWEKSKLINSEDLSKLYLIRKNGSIEEVDGNLEFTRICELLPVTHPSPKKIDCDIDGVDEIIFHHETSEKVTILRNDLLDPIIIDVPGNDYLFNAGIVLNGDESPLLNLRMDNYSYLYKYYKNPLYSYRFIFYFLTYFGIFGFLIVLQKAQNYRLQQKFNAQKEISELQMKSIKNQMDPHFTLNIMNSIGSLFSKQETENANYIFGKYSKLLRQTILSSDQILTTLNDELEYVENYMTLEQFRIKDGFDINIDIEEGINKSIKIPKMLVHSFIENSIKHGIRHISYRGKIKISVINGSSNYQIKVTDNGIGRKKAKELSKFSTGKGLEIVDQILQLYFTLEKNKITYKTIDLMDEFNNPKGTEVIINIPIFT
jgi:two-component sensor histidine kinase